MAKAKFKKKTSSINRQEFIMDSQDGQDVRFFPEYPVYPCKGGVMVRACITGIGWLN